MAKRIQNSLVRIALAKSVFSYKLARRNAARDIQRVYRGGCRRDVIREWNRHELLAHAYANAARLLIKHNRGARKIRSLRTAGALITKHEKDGDSAIHRAARGIGDQSVYACIKHLNLAADAITTREARRYIIGLDLDPPLRIARIKKREEKGEGGRAGGRQEREIYLACERMGTVYKNKANASKRPRTTAPTTRPSRRRGKSSARDRRREICYGEDRADPVALSRPNTAEQPQIAGGIMDILHVCGKDPSTNSILKKLDSDSESDMSKSSDEARSDSASTRC